MKKLNNHNRFSKLLIHYCLAVLLAVLLIGLPKVSLALDTGSYPNRIFYETITLDDKELSESSPLFHNTYEINTTNIEENEVVFGTMEFALDDIDADLFDEDEDEKTQDIYVGIYDSNGTCINSFYASFDETWRFWFSADEIKGTHADVYIENTSSDFSYTINCELKSYNGFCNNIEFPTSISLKTNGKKTLNAAPVSDDCLFEIINWVSSDKKIATVSKDGMVTAKSKGTCYIKVELAGGATATCKVVVKDPPPKLSEKSISLSKGSSTTLKLKYATKKVTWKTSNSKIASVSKKGVVKAKGFGKCTITAKSGGKTYKCKVLVYRESPDYFAQIDYYNTRNNYFRMRIRNTGDKKLYITSGVKIRDNDYKKYDRKVYLKKSVTIKPHSTKYVRFYIKGNNTWPDVTDFTLYYKFKYHGKKYDGRVWYQGCQFKSNKRWLDAYVDDEEYDDWLYLVE